MVGLVNECEVEGGGDVEGHSLLENRNGAYM